MEQPLEEAYFSWLCAKVNTVMVPTPSLTYLRLLRRLHSTEFVWLVLGDDNRAQDGVDLRLEFFKESFLKVDPMWSAMECSMLEMLIAFSRRAEFDTDRSSREWFWEMMENVGLDLCNDASDVTLDEIDFVLSRVIWRTYDANGRGGLFPLASSPNDQRKVEIWYQFCEYLVDKAR